MLESAHLESAHLGSAHLGSVHLGSAHLESVHLGSVHLASAHLESALGSAARITQPWCVYLGDLFLLSASLMCCESTPPVPQTSWAQAGPYHVGLLPWSAWRTLLAQPGSLVVVFVLTTVGVLRLG